MHTNFIKVILVALSASLLSLIIVSCSTTKDATANSSAVTDFVVGQSYRLAQPCFIWNGRLIEKEFAGSEATLPTGTRMTVRKVLVFHPANFGSYVSVYVQILDGSHAGRIFPINGRPGEAKTFLKRTDEVFQPVE